MPRFLWKEALAASARWLAHGLCCKLATRPALSDLLYISSRRIPPPTAIAARDYPQKIKSRVYLL
jgi:hypothetical protein